MGNKKCTSCNEIKSLVSYAYRSKKNNTRKYRCKECDKKERREYYLKNKSRIISDVLGRNEGIKNRNKKFIWDYLENNPCVDCGENNPIVLEFDHRDGVEKTNCVSIMSANKVSINNLIKEINKCDVRCANCHKIRTAKQQGWYKSINKDL
jgi:hypothetical protein